MKTIGLVPELYVTDLGRSLAFYLDALDFDVLYRRDEDSFAYLRRENAELMLEQIGESRNWISGDLQHPFGRGLNLQIEVSDVDELYRKTEDAGMKPFLAMEEKWYRKGETFVGNRQFMIEDPDGYLLRFYQDLGSR